jgi:uncharacterized SAM-binding protein YcdF (DUF218 family)
LFIGSTGTQLSGISLVLALMDRRFVHGGLRLLLGLVLGWAIASAVLFVWPPKHTLTHADAALVLAGGRGPRLERGLDLVRRGDAPVLVVSDGWSATWPEANRLCAGRKAPVPVICFHPAPYRTYGEARAFTRLAERRGWSSVILVSSRYHLERARMLFTRCYDGRIGTEASPGSLSSRILAAPIETAKLGYGLLIRRAC